MQFTLGKKSVGLKKIIYNSIITVYKYKQGFIVSQKQERETFLAVYVFSTLKEVSYEWDVTSIGPDLSYFVFCSSFFFKSLYFTSFFFTSLMLISAVEMSAIF